MELIDFLRQTQAEVRSEIGDRLGANGEAYPYPESVFSEVVMQHMSDVGMTFEPQACHYSAKVANANLRLSGWAMSEAPRAPGAVRTCRQAASDFQKKRGTSASERTSRREAMTRARVCGRAGLGVVQGSVGMGSAFLGRRSANPRTEVRRNR